MITQYGLENIYYQDESGFDEYFTRLYGYSKKGEKIYTQTSGKRYERQSITALRNFEHKLVEPVIYQGTADSQLIYAYFESILPKLMQKSVIIMDNASFHKS